MNTQAKNNPSPKTNREPETSVPLLDVARGNKPLREEILARIAEVYDSGRFILGPECEKLEEAMTRLCNTKHAVGCASGSDALLLALTAIDIGPGDEVLVPSFTFFATASAVTRLGAKPVWVDIDPVTYNVDPERIEAAVTPATKAIIPVHLFGQCAEMDPICELARRHGLVVIEDAAQAHGAAYRERPAGSMGQIGCFSFYPTKNLGGCGDAGMLVTSDDALAEKLRQLRNHGMHPRYYHPMVGVNSRLDSMQAAALNVKLPHLAQWTKMRQENAARYIELFSKANLDEVVRSPQTAPNRLHVWNQFMIGVPGGYRDALREHLTRAKIGSEIYYPVALHQQECFRKLGLGDCHLPQTERATREVLHLPIFPELTAEEQEIVVDRMAHFFAERAGDSHAITGPNFLRHARREASTEHRSA